MENIFKKKGEKMKYDLAVIGGGLGGYPAAINLARRGYNVVLFEENYLGGECTNYGCVPSKAFYHIGEAIYTLKKLGLETSINWNKITNWIREIVGNVRNDLEELLTRYDVKIIYGKAVVKGHNVIQVNGVEYVYENLLLAPGTDPKPLPNIHFDNKFVLSNREIFYINDPVQHLLIVGGGVIGVEIANMFADLGVDITLVEALDHILPFLDKDIALMLKRHLIDKGVKIYEKTLVGKINIEENSVKIRLSNNKIIEADKVLVSIGRIPRTQGIGLEKIGVETDKQGYIQVNRYCRVRGLNNIYGAGDAIGPPLLAHKAIIESIISSINIMGENMEKPENNLIPQTIFSGLEIASIGYTEKMLKEKSINYTRIKLPIYYLSSVKIKGNKYSFIKVLVDKNDHDKIYGIHIIAPNASEIISSFIPFYLAKMSLNRARFIPYPHLTVSEVVREIAEYLLGEPIHIFVKK